MGHITKNTTKIVPLLFNHLIWFSPMLVGQLPMFILEGLQVYFLMEVLENRIIGCCSVTQSCPTLCHSMGCSTPGISVPHHLPRFAQASCPLHQWCHPAISSSDTLFSSCLQSFPASGTFPTSRLFTSDDQNTGVSTSALVLSTSIQGRFPSRLTSLISLLSKGLLAVNYNKDHCSNSQNLGRFIDSVELLG